MRRHLYVSVPGDLVSYIKEPETIGIVIGTGLVEDCKETYERIEPCDVLVYIVDIGLHWTRQRSIVPFR